MARKCLIEWYEKGDVTYSEKERLNKIGVGDYDRDLSLQDLKQILRCENWAKTSSEIRNELAGRIKKIVFFTPDFNDSKPAVSNYSCAIVKDGSDNNWVIVYRPSYAGEIGSDVFNFFLRGVVDNTSSLIEQIEHENRRFDNLTSSYSYEKNKIEQYIRVAENNRSYTRTKYQIEQEKFEERIVTYPKDWCRIS